MSIKKMIVANVRIDNIQTETVDYVTFSQWMQEDETPDEAYNRRLDVLYPHRDNSFFETDMELRQLVVETYEINDVTGNKRLLSAMFEKAVSRGR